MTCTIVFAKAPLAGYAKTRLTQSGNGGRPPLTPQQAAKLAERMLQHAIEQACQAELGPVELCCSPDSSHPLFASLAERHGIILTQQGEGDLGARMQRALERALHAHGRVLLTGTDAPALNASYLRAAASALDTHDAVFVPTHDGGYALIGVRTALPCLFHDMPWSTPDVMALTRSRLSAAAVHHAEVATLHDIDEADDLAHVPAAWLAELGQA